MGLFGSFGWSMANFRYRKSLSDRDRSFNVSLCRVIRIDDIIIRTRALLLVGWGKRIDRRGVDNRTRLALNIPQCQVFEDFFEHIRILYESNDQK